MAKVKIDTDQRAFIMVYKDFLESEKLKGDEKMMFISLKSYANNKQACYPSLSKLASITGYSKRKVQDLLKKLEEKKVLTKENRMNSNGSKSSNLYVLKDYAEMWKSKTDDELKSVVDTLTAEQYIKALKDMGYNVDNITKEKGAVHSDTWQSDHTEKPAKLTHRNNNKKTAKSQEKYSLDIIKKIYEYNILLEREPLHKDDINSVINILYDTLNTTKKSIRILSEDKPADVVIGKLLKLKIEDILYAIKQFEKQTSRITNPVGYMLTLLYKAQEQSNLDVQNQVSHDFAHLKEHKSRNNNSYIN